MKEVSIGGKMILLDGLPASMDLLLITTTYFLIGYEFRRRIPERFFASIWSLVISGLMLIALNIVFPYRVDLFFRTYDSYIVNTLEGLSGSIFVLSISSRIALKQNRLSEFFKYFGEITIILLIFHQPTQTRTFGHVMRLVDNIYFAGIVSFIASVSVPVLIHQLFLKDNSRLAGWFGLRQKTPVTQDSST